MLNTIRSLHDFNCPINAKRQTHDSGFVMMIGVKRIFGEMSMRERERKYSDRLICSHSLFAPRLAINYMLITTRRGSPFYAN